VVSTQHDERVTNGKLKKAVIEKVIRPVLKNYLDAKTEILVNPTGRFVRGGPPADTGMTGRKIIVDTYGGMARHGGGAFSGKDPTKVDRSAAYAARWVAKNLVAAGFADRLELQLAYAIGHPKPISINVETFGTGKIADEKMIMAIKKVFDLSPAGILKSLDLIRPIYLKTATGGHFGRPEFAWEKINRVTELRKNI
ncbi:MAG: methionine adenosyltransferase domain-containing protein, partial [Candidatus Peribacteraceae bacterium]|nr:methionine adenosyltransferase domain-containing protein [Candidatus Peribacteraceae bacterium]